MLVPKLRFKREDETDFPEWEGKRVGEILTLCHGKDYKHLKKGDIPVMGTGGVITYVNEALCDWQCVCIGRKGTIDRPYFMDKPFWSVDTLFYSKPFSDNMPKFQYYLFQNINWQLYNEASGVPSLSASTIENVKVKVPDIEEQQKIADFLSAIDEVIAQSEAEVQNLEQQKKAAMQKIFSQEARFQREDGTDYPEWEERTISELGTVVTGNTPPTKEKENYGGDFLWVTPTDISDYPIINDTERKLSDIGKNKARVLPKNSVLITCIASIGKNCILAQEGSCNQQINAVVPKTCTNPYFLLNAINYKKHELEVLGGNGGMKIVSKSLFEQFSISIPTEFEEQQKIAVFLSAYDEAIRYAKQELDKWKELKKGLLQQMFV